MHLVVILDPPSIEGLATVATAAPVENTTFSSSVRVRHGAVGDNVIVTVGSISGAAVDIVVLVAL